MMDANEMLAGLVGDPRLRPLIVVASSLVLALLTRVLFVRVIKALTRKTRTDIDDRIAYQLRRPLITTIILVGLLVAHLELDAPQALTFVIKGLIVTVIGLLWSVALVRVGRILLQALSDRVDQLAWIEPRTLPLFEMVLKVAAIGGFLYVVCLAWDIPLTSWLTSAGIVGIAIGFAAKDTLSNLFSGIFIVADSPYKVGDFVVLDNTIRGQVLEIGIRSTRLLTRDDIEVTVPNAVIANSQIVNQSGGPNEKMRVRIKVDAAYGSNVDQVRKVLLGSIEGVQHVCGEPAPRVRFRAFGASGLAFELLAWVDTPVNRGRVIDELNTNVYNSFRAAGIEIPYSKHDVYVKELPGRSGEY
jgi:MscS family membrane protein